MSKLGISYNSLVDPFLSSQVQTAILLAKLFTELNYEVVLIDTKNADNPKSPLDVPIVKLHEAKNVDIFIDIDGYVNSSYRKKIAKKSIVFMRTFMQFEEMDNAVYPEKEYRPRSFEDVAEIWCWDILNPEETLPSIQTLFPCKITRVPFIWSPSHITNLSSPTHNKDGKWHVHISEKNNTNSSSSVIPLVAIREMTLKNAINAAYKCHNMEKIQENRFLKENVFNNIDISNLPVEFTKKEPFYNWLKEENAILFSHTRFSLMRIGLLNALWLGLPVIHNCPIIQELHPILDKMYYSGNEFAQICAAFQNFTSSPQEFYEAYNEIKAAIQKKWSIKNNLEKWRSILNIPNSNQYTIYNQETTYKEDYTKTNKIITVGFTHMWDGFNYDSNFITDALREECKSNQYITIKGAEIDTLLTDPDLIILGPFVQGWNKLPHNVPKVFFTAENWPVADDESISLYLTPSRIEDDKHMRLPTWMTFIDWYSGKTDLSQINTNDNPNRLPINMALNPHSKPFKDRTEFCGFVVSNPICSFRNEAFYALNEYKKVNSGGELFNNIGGRLGLKYPGGGCGDIPKYDFFSNHKFTLSFENSQAPGYITEKVLHAKMAGCVPLYWGDKDTDTDFVPGSIINVSQLSSPDQIVKVVQKLEENPEMCAKIAATPILNEEKKQKALAIISRMAKKILNLVNIVQEELVQEESVLEGIDDIFVINLDKRKDRWEALEPYLKSTAKRVAAVDGKALKLNSEIYNLFKNNTFSWKKSVIGCFLSHISVWKRILKEPGTHFLVLEDDVRFDKDWIDTLNKCIKSAPEDADILYLGGILPPNKAALPHCLEQVSNEWSKIKPNTFFTPIEAPVFHFCAYSYVLTKKGAEKLLSYLETSDLPLPECDHFIGGLATNLKKYIMTPLIAHCFQDDDQEYIQSQFNDLHKVNKFDSDIWNSTDCFLNDDLAPYKNVIDAYYIDEGRPFEIYEQIWLEDMFKVNINCKPLTNQLKPDSLYIVQRSTIDKMIEHFKVLRDHNISFKVLHLSDEFATDDISFYEYPNCKGVIRNYVRSNIPDLDHITTIPLGYHHKEESMKSFEQRNLVWSFHGTSWFNRRELLVPLMSQMPHHLHFTDMWNDPNKTDASTYLGTLDNSKFCPILRGNNIETFRLYEALELGVIPLYVRIDGDEHFWNLIKPLQLVELKSWEDATKFVKYLLEVPVKAEQYRQNLVRKWNEWKECIQQSCQKLIITNQ